MADFRPNMAFSWASPPVTSPTQPQNRTLPTWGAVGSPDYPHASYNPNAPVSLARKVVGYAGLGGLGTATAYETWRQQYPVAAVVLPVVSFVGGIAAGYHGFKRNKGSIGWTIGWWILGAWFPLITLPVAYFQGYAKPAR